MKAFNLKKKIACMLLMALFITSISTGKFVYALPADENDVTTSGLDYSEGKVPSENKEYKAGGGKITYEAASKTLKLENATINTGANTALNLGLEDFTIVVKGKNEITTSKGHAIKGRVIEIKGENNAELILTSNDATDQSACGVYCNAFLISGSINVTVSKVGVNGASADYVSAIYSDSGDLKLSDSAKLTVKEGTVDLNGSLNTAAGTEFNARIVKAGNIDNAVIDGTVNAMVGYSFYEVYGNVSVDKSLFQFNLSMPNGLEIKVGENAILNFDSEAVGEVKAAGFNIVNNGTINFSDNVKFQNPTEELFFKKIKNEGTINVAEGKKVTFDLKQLPYMEGSGQFNNNGIVEFKITEDSDDIEKVKSFNIKNGENGVIIFDKNGTKQVLAAEGRNLAIADKNPIDLKSSNLSGSGDTLKFIPDGTNSSAVEDGEAYMLYDFAKNEMTLKNFYYKAADITLPSKTTKINLIGKNILYNSKAKTPVFLQGESSMKNAFEAFMNNGTKPTVKTDRGITFTGDGSLNIFSAKNDDGRKTVETDGNITVESGRIYSDTDEVETFENKKFGNSAISSENSVFGIVSSSYNQNGGYIALSDTKGSSLETVDFNMTGGKFFTIVKDANASELVGTPRVYGNLSVTGGEFKPSFIESAHIVVMGDVNYTANNAAIISKMNFPDEMPAPPLTIEKLGKTVFMVYGDIKKEAYDKNGEKISVETPAPIITLGLRIPMFSKLEMQSNSSIIVEKGEYVDCKLYFANTHNPADNLKVDIKDVIPNNAKIINKGKFVISLEQLEKAELDKKIKEIATYLKLQGDGTISVEYENGDKFYYNNDGSPKNTVENSFSFNFEADSDARESADKSVTWEKKPALTDQDKEEYTLTLNNVYLESNRDIIFPDNAKVIVKLVGGSEVGGDIECSGTRQFDLTIAGNGTLNLKKLPSGSANDDVLTVEGGAKVYVKSDVLQGTAGGADSLTVKGAGTVFDIDASSSAAREKGLVSKDINVTDGAELSIRSKDVSAYTVAGSSVNVTNGSKLKVSCKYGVYVVDGKLTVDDTSTLETVAKSAGIAVVDTTNAKAQADVLSLPAVPYGTNITSVEKGGSKLWTVANVGSQVAVVGNDAELYDDITGAAGKLTIKKGVDKAPDSGSYSSGENSGSSGGGSLSVGTGGSTSGNKAEITVKAKKGKSKSASVVISEKSIENALEKAKEEMAEKGKEAREIPLEVSVAMPKGSKKLKVSLTASTLEKLIDEEVGSLAIKTPLVRAVFNKNAISELKKRAKSGISLSLIPKEKLPKKVRKLIGKRPVYDIRLSYGKKKEIKKLKNGKIRVIIPYKLSKNESAEGLYAVYIDKKGKAHKIKGSIYDKKSGTLSFSTSQLRVYSIGYKEP